MKFIKIIVLFICCITNVILPSNQQLPEIGWEVDTFDRNAIFFDGVFREDHQPFLLPNTKVWMLSFDENNKKIAIFKLLTTVTYNQEKKRLFKIINIPEHVYLKPTPNAEKVLLTVQLRPLNLTPPHQSTYKQHQALKPLSSTVAQEKKISSSRIDPTSLTYDLPDDLL